MDHPQFASRRWRKIDLYTELSTLSTKIGKKGEENRGKKKTYVLCSVDKF